MPLTRRCPRWRTLLAGYSRVTDVRALPRTESDRGESLRPGEGCAARAGSDRGWAHAPGFNGTQAVTVGRSGVVRASTCLRAGRMHGWARVRSPVSPLATGPERSECCSCGLGGGQALRRYRWRAARSTSVCRSPGSRRMRRVGAVVEASWPGSPRRLWRSSRWCTRPAAARAAPCARDPRAPARAVRLWPRRVPRCGPRPRRSARGRVVPGERLRDGLDRRRTTPPARRRLGG